MKTMMRCLVVAIFTISAQSHALSEKITSGSSDSLLVPVAGGTFTAGTTLTTISSFKIDKYEVTYELWTAVRAWAMAHSYTDLVAGQNGSSPVGANNPVTMVNWYDIVKWCNARSEKDGLTPLYYTGSMHDSVYRSGNININIDAVKWNANGYRLPTETEWEFAARGGNQTHGYLYSGSNTTDEIAWYTANSGGTTHRGGTKAANELGIYDMTGNVWEWLWDWYGSAYPSGGTTDPQGPSTTQTYRLVRGGSFFDIETFCRVTHRGSGRDAPYARDYRFGFRCVQGSQVGTAVKGEVRMPQTFGLTQNYPNPFNPATTVDYSIPQQSQVTVKIFDLLGREVAVLVNENKYGGRYSVQWNAAAMPSGIYFYRINAGQFQETKTMILLK